MNWSCRLKIYLNSEMISELEPESHVFGEAGCTVTNMFKINRSFLKRKYALIYLKKFPQHVCYSNKFKIKYHCYIQCQVYPLFLLFSHSCQIHQNLLFLHIYIYMLTHQIFIYFP